MTILIDTLSPLFSILGIAASLLAGSFFSVLTASYHLAGEAGVTRLQEKFPRATRSLDFWRSRWALLPTALMICAMAFGVISLILAIHAVRDHSPDTPAGLFAAVFIMVVGFVFALDIVPRVLSESYADRIAAGFMPLAQAVALILFPAAWLFARMEGWLHRRCEAGSDEDDRPTSEDEIRSIIENAPEEDFEEEEREWIRSVFEFSDTLTREIMTPRVDMNGISDASSIAQAVEAMRSSPHSRFPVYHETLDEIRGVVHVKDLLSALSLHQDEESILKVLKTVPYVPESMPIDALLNLMRAQRSHICIVVDEYGGTAGLVTMEDVIEEIVGEIEDEYDPAIASAQPQSDGSFIVEAKLPVYEVNRQLGLQIPETEEYDSIGGYIFQKLGKIPKPGEILEAPGCTLTVQTATPTRLLAIRVTKTIAAEVDSE